MRYPISNRFAGALVGSYIGENYLKPSATSLKNLNWTKIGIANSKLGCQGKIDNPEATIVASLPEILLSHETQQLLTEKLNQITQVSPANREGLLIWGTALSLACREKLQPNRFLEQIKLELEGSLHGAQQTLTQIQKSLERNTSVISVGEELLPTNNCPLKAIALALYCFASTPEDFQLCLKRAARTNYQPPLTLALTGALAGAYNSLSGIPLAWRSSAAERANLEDIYQFARELFACWSGVYQPNSTRAVLKFAEPAIAANLQTRSGWQIISRK